MADLTLISDHSEDTLRWRAHYQGILAAELSAEISGTNAVLHNRIYLWSKTLCRGYVGLYERIREQLKSRGISLVMVCSDRYTDKMGRYWKLMGFKIFYEVSGTDGEKYPAAVMEV